MIRTVIIDDEEIARKTLQNYLNDFCEDVTVLASVGSLEEALVAIHVFHPELVFLDIELNDQSGFDLLAAVPKIDFKIVFVTAFSEFAIRAFRYYATDYLLKPVNISELIDAVDKVRKELTEDLDNKNIEFLNNHHKEKTDEFDVLVIRDTKGFKVIETKDIIKCEAKGILTIFFLTSNRQEVSSKNLGFYEETLVCPPFIRVHHSFIINLRLVQRYHTKDQTIFLAEDHAVPLGNKYKGTFLEFFK